MDIANLAEQRATIMVDGKQTEIRARDVKRSILAAMTNHNLTPDDAWERVQVDMARMLGGERPGTPTMAQTDLCCAATEAVAGSVSLEDAPAVAAAAPPPLDSQNSLQTHPPATKNPLTQALRGEALRKMVLEQHENDLHPQANLLARVDAVDPIRDAVDPRRAEDRQQVQDLGLRFPPAPTGRSAFPADLCRTSIFHVASNNVPRRQCDEEAMGQIGDQISISYSGIELRHDDERVLMQLIQIAQHLMPWQWIEISTIPFARQATGSKRKLGKTDAESVDDALWRLRKGLVVLARDRNFIPFNPIRELSGAGSKRYVQLDVRMVLLFKNSYVLLDDKVYHETRGIERQIFKYLHTNQHEKIYPVKVQTLFELCYGSIEALKTTYMKETLKSEKDARRAILKKVSDFRKKGLPAALHDLQAKHVIASFEADEKQDKVTIHKGAFFSQNARPALAASAA